VESPTPDLFHSSNDVRQLQRLLECTRLLNSTLDLAELTLIVLQIARDEVGFERGTLFVIDSATNWLRSFVAEGVENFEITLPVGSGIAGSVAASGSILDIVNVEADPRFRPEFDHRLTYKTRDIYCMPVVNGTGTVVGVLQLLNRSRTLTADDKHFLSAISVHLGLAVERAWFCHQLNRKAEIERELQQVRDEIGQLEKMSLIGALTAGLVHELRNPLASLMAHTSFMREDPELTPGLAQRLDKIDLSAKSALDVVGNFLNFSRREGAVSEPADLGTTIQATLDILSHECRRNKVKVETRIGETPEIAVSRGEIQQVLMNLVKNGIDAIAQTGKPGTVEISSAYDPDRNVVRVEVTDSGPGIAPANESRLFRPFFTTKADGKGTGLGLSICRRLVERHEGRIGYLRPDVGSTFWFEFPCGRG
jgi:signal transduction histidine kinase